MLSDYLLELVLFHSCYPTISQINDRSTRVCKEFAQMRLSLIVVRGLRAPPSIISQQFRGTETPHYNGDGMSVQKLNAQQTEMLGIQAGQFNM